MTDAPGRYYSDWEDQLLIDYGASGLPWSDAPAFLGRSTPPALRARWLLIEPPENKARRLGIPYVPLPGVKKRACLTCGKAFDSVGIGNRRCQPCKDTYH